MPRYRHAVTGFVATTPNHLSAPWVEVTKPESPAKEKEPAKKKAAPKKKAPAPKAED